MNSRQGEKLAYHLFFPWCFFGFSLSLSMRNLGGQEEDQEELKRCVVFTFSFEVLVFWKQLLAPGCTRIQSEELEFFCKVLLDNVLSSSTFRRYSKGPAAVYVQNHNLMLPRYAFVTHRIRRPKQAVVAGTPGLQGTALGIVFAIFTRLHRVKIALCNTQFCCRKLRYIECVPQAKEFPTHQHVNHLFVKWPNVLGGFTSSWYRCWCMGAWAEVRPKQ